MFHRIEPYREELPADVLRSQSEIEKTGQEATLTLDLAALGWDGFFEQTFAPFRDEGAAPARVAREERNAYLVYCAQGELAAEVSGRFRHEAQSRSDFPVVGDWVAVQPSPDPNRTLIRAVLPRRSKFSRKVAWVRTEEQVIAANIDTLFLVTGLDLDFNLRRIERYLVLARESGCCPIVVLSKADLCPDVSARVAQVAAIAPGVAILPVSAVRNQGLETIGPYLLPRTTVALLGSSGVGKSTLVNTLLGEDRLAVGPVRPGDDRGRHVTSRRELIPLPSGALLIDNPGMREIQLWCDEQGVDDAFADITELAGQCRFSDCRHLAEPDCAVQRALETGKLDLARFRGYLKMKKELQHLAVRQHQLQRRAEKAKSKKPSRET